MATLIEKLNSQRKEYSFGDISTFRYGKMPKDVQQKGKYPIFSGYRIVGYTDTEYNSDENLIIVARGVGGTGDVKISPVRSYITNLSIIADLNDSLVDKTYLFYRFQLNNLKFLDSGSAQSQITIQDLNPLKIVLPDLTTQKKIASILSAYDEKIENNNKIIKNLEVMAQTIFNEWFVNFKFPGHEKVKMVESEMGEIPEGWEVKSVLDVIERIPSGKKYDNKSASPKGRVPILDQEASGFIGYHDDEPGVVASIDDNPVVVFTNHTCYYRILTEPFSCIQNVLPYVGKNGYDTFFVYFLTKGKIKMSEYKGHWPEFEQQIFIIPTPDVAKGFSEKAKTFIEKIVACEKENTSLKSQRDQLLAKLI